MKALFSILLVVVLYLPLRAKEGETPELLQRYEAMLLQNPQPGKAFEEIIGWYTTEGDGLETLEKRWAKALESGDGATRQARFIVAGMLAQRRHQVPEVRQFYEKALGEKGSHLHQAARLLAALETTEGNFPQAVKAYERALSDEALPPVDRLELIRSLALLHSRAFEDEKALALWREAIAQAPHDPQVLEEAGEAFLSANAYADARAVFGSLRKVSENDPYRRTLATILLARTADQEGKTEQAAAIYQEALDETSEGSWFSRDLRARLDEMYRRKEDLPGLQTFYEKRLKTHPHDHRTWQALSRVQTDLKQTEAALATMQKAVQLVPGDEAARLELIELLANSKRDEEALEQAGELARSADASESVLLLSGKLQWEAAMREGKPALREAAWMTWKRLAPEDSKEIGRLMMLADLLARHEAPQEAIAIWRRVLSISPEAMDARVKLAQAFLQQEKEAEARKVIDEALTTHDVGAERYLAVVQAQIGLQWEEAAKATLAKALKQFPEDGAVLQSAWRAALENGSLPEIEALYPKVLASASNLFAQEAILSRFARFLQEHEEAARRWSREDHALALQMALFSGKEEAARAALAALESAGGDPVALLRARARLMQAFGSVDEQIAALQAVSEADPRLAVESERTIVRLLQGEGRFKQARERLDQLITRTPSDVALYEQYAEITFQEGNSRDAVQRLREGLRHVEDGTTLRLKLVQLAQAEGRFDEAAQVLEEAFENEERLSRRKEIFRLQAEVARSRNRLEDLIASLRERQSREQGGARYGAFLAEVYILQHDYQAAREELARSLGETPDDPHALRQLLTLCDRGGDQEEGLRLARRLAEVEPTAENRADCLQRLFRGNPRNEEEILSALDLAREEILSHPGPWYSLLTILRQNGFRKEIDALLIESAARQTGISGRMEQAQMAILIGDFGKAQESLRTLLEEADLAGVLVSVFPVGGVQGKPYYPQREAIIAARVRIQTLLSQLLQSNPGGYYLLIGGATSSLPKETVETLEGLLLLGQLMEVERRSEEYFAFLDSVMSRKRVPTLPRLLLYLHLDYREGYERQAEEWLRQSPVEAVKLIQSSPGTFAWVPNRESLIAILEKINPQAALPLRERSPEESLKLLRERLEAPVDPEKPITFGEVGAALGLKEVELALALRERAREESDPSAAPRQGVAVYHDWSLAIELMKRDHPKALEVTLNALDSIVQNAAFSSPRIPYLMMGTGLSEGESTLPLNLGTGRLDLPWLVKHRGEDRRIALLEIYALAQSGDYPKAIAAMESLQAREPLPVGVAFLMKLYDAAGEYAKALTLLESKPPLHPLETRDERELRRVRLLRLLEREEEARLAMEALMRKNLPGLLRQTVMGEAQHLGIRPPFSPYRTHSQTRADRVQLIVAKIRALLDKEQPEEAEKVGIALLKGPLPGSPNQSYHYSLRREVISRLTQKELLEGYRWEVSQRLTKDPADLEAAMRLFELAGRDEKRKAAVLPQVLEAVRVALKEGRQLGDLPLVLEGLSHASVPDGLAKIAVQIVQQRPELIASGEINFSQLLRYIINANHQLPLTEALVAMDERSFLSMSARYRLRSPQMFHSEIGAMVDGAVAQGKPEWAVVLLERILPELGSDLRRNVQLAGLQASLKRKDEAVATFRQALSYRSNNVRMTRSFHDMLQQEMSGSTNAQVPILEEIGRLAQEIGLKEELLATLKESETAMSTVPLTLILKTYLGEENLGKEWRAFLSRDDANLTSFSIVALPAILEALSRQESGREVIPQLLAKVDLRQMSQQAYIALSHLSKTVPLLLTWKGEPAVERYLDKMIEALSSSHTSGSIEHSPDFRVATTALIEGRFFKQVRALLEIADSRRPPSQEVDPETLEAAARLKALDHPEKYQILSVAYPRREGELKVDWKVIPKPELRTDVDYRLAKARWDVATPILVRERYPRQLTFYAGPHPLAMRKVGAIARPKELSGSLNFKAPGPLGLLQVRWQDASGRAQAGPLTLYAMGENLMPKEVPFSVPLEAGKAPLAEGGFGFPLKTGGTRLEIPLLKVPIDADHVVVATGWSKGGRYTGESLQIKMSLNKAGVTRRNAEDLIRNPSVFFGQWMQFYRAWGEETTPLIHNQVPGGGGELEFKLILEGSAVQHAIGELRAGFAGGQVIRIPKEALKAMTTYTGPSYKEAMGKEDYAEAVRCFEAEAQVNPAIFLSSDWLSIVEKGGAVADPLLALLRNPILYEPNPLLGDLRATVGGARQLKRLVRLAMAPDARPALVQWLKEIERHVTLPSGVHAMVEILRLKQKSLNAPEHLTVEELMEAIRWRGEETVNLGDLWTMTDEKDQPLLLEWLDTARRSGKAAELLKELRKRALQHHDASLVMMEAFLALPDAPAQALQHWKDALSLHQQQGRGNIPYQAVDLFFQKIAVVEVPPDQVMSQIRLWASIIRTGPSQQVDFLLSTLYPLTRDPSPHQEAWRAMWAQEMMANLEHRQVRSEEISRLITYYQERKEDAKLDLLLERMARGTAANRQGIRDELAKLDAIRRFAKGEVGNTWPVIWYAPPSTGAPREATLYWQWTTRNVAKDRSAVDAAVLIPATPLADEVQTQTGVEIFFGEWPGTLERIASVEGKATSGTKGVSLPAANGFLRVEAVFADGNRVRGPLVPYLSGKRIYPAPEESLMSFLQRGPEPWSKELLHEAGTAPDGSSAIAIGKEGSRRQKLRFRGMAHPAEPARFLVSRGWFRRVNRGHLTAATLYRDDSVPDSKALNMVLTSGREATDQWIYFTRAVPSLPQHTFFVPFKKVRHVIPRLWSVEHGTQLAGWELLEITDWSYGQWLCELALYREEERQPKAAKVFELAQKEPLTALDYHGSWIVGQLTDDSVFASRVPALFRTALEADPNPLFGKPKLGRIFAALQDYLLNERVPVEARREALALALEQEPRYGVQQWIGYQRAALALNRTPEQRKAIAADLRKRLETPEGRGRLLPVLLQTQLPENGSPDNVLLNLCRELEDATLIRALSAGLEKDTSNQLPALQRQFALLALDHLLADSSAVGRWESMIESGFRESEAEESLAKAIAWPTLVATIIGKDAPASEQLLALRQGILTRVLAQSAADARFMREYVRAATGLIAVTTARGENEKARTAVGELALQLKPAGMTLSQEATREVNDCIQTLKAAGLDPEAKVLQQAMQ